jgi:hypothetical protein
MAEAEAEPQVSTEVIAIVFIFIKIAPCLELPASAGWLHFYARRTRKFTLITSTVNR